MRSWLVWVPLGIIFLSISLVGGSFYFFSTRPANPGISEKTPFEVERGQSLASIAKDLEKAGLITSANRFIWLGKLTRQAGQIKAGEYEISPDQTPLEIYQILCSGISVSRPFTIPEGYNQYEVAGALEKQGFGSKREYLTLFKDRELIRSLELDEPPPSSMEGYLFPDTYLFHKKMTPQERVLMMIRKFKSEWKDKVESHAQTGSMSPREILILASVIEKETGAPEERRKISSVFHNRLNRRMRLQSDPTTIYGVWEKFGGNLRKTHLEEKTPYNTYRIDGLPQGPICNPGTESLLAAIYPEKTDYLYFVSMNDGTHQFSRTYEEHLAAVRKFQLDPKARQGKSWRDRKNPPSTTTP